MANDTAAGGDDEGLSVEQAAAAFMKATAAPAVRKDHADEVEPQDSEETDDELQASDEDAGEEDDGETADTDHAEVETEADDEPDSGKGRFAADDARVRITNPDGTTGFTTVAELKRGSLREADYTRKTQEASAVRQEAERQSAAIKASEQQLSQQRDYVISLVKSIVPAAPDPALLNTDPVGYMQQEAQHKQWVQHLRYLESEQQRAEITRQQKSGETEKQTAEREWNALLTKVPDLKDEKRLKAFAADIEKHGAEYGFNGAELKSVALDHRQALVFKDAIAWRKLQASKGTIAKKVEGRPPVQKGGKRLNPHETRARNASDAFADLKKSGSVEDAARAFLATRRTG